MSRAVAGLALALITCSSSSSGGGDTPTEGPCACIVDEAAQTEWVEPMSPTCAEQLCSHISSGEGADGSFYVDSSAVDCALEALRDRTPGWIAWSSGTDSDDSLSGGYILIQPEGTAVFREWDADGLPAVVSDATAGELPSAAHYEDCLAEPDDIARYNCVRNTELTTTMVCNSGWTVD